MGSEALLRQRKNIADVHACFLDLQACSSRKKSTIRRKEKQMARNRRFKKLNAPIFDVLIAHDRNSFKNPEQPSAALMAAMDPLFQLLRPLKPSPKNDEAKVLWIIVPRGTSNDWMTFEDARESEEVKTHEEYIKLWKEYYPDEFKWYQLILFENRPDRLDHPFRALMLDNSWLINADLSSGTRAQTYFSEEPVIELLPLITEAAARSMDMLQNRTYNSYVETNLPYQNRFGVIRRSDLWKADPKAKEYAWEHMDEKTYQQFQSFLPSNKEDQIGRLQSFTADDFFHACYLGYQACGYDLSNMTPVQAYLHYADGRDEGLTGTGHGLNEGPGIDFSSPSAWDEWYSSSRGGGHPWEVIPGGNSTHVSLFVMHDGKELEYLLRLGKISEKEYEERKAGEGYYFRIAGKHREWESIRLFVALRSAGLPAILDDAPEIAAKYDGTGYVGIVPHNSTTAYCEHYFPAKYGPVIDAMHIFSEDEYLLPYVEWLPEEHAELME